MTSQLISVCAMKASLILIAGFLRPCIAQDTTLGGSATQTTWEGVWRNVRGQSEWYDRFRSAWGIDWLSIPGSLVLTSGYYREPIRFDRDFVITSFLPSDVDSDGDIDLFLLQKLDNRIGWLENVRQDSSWLYHNIQDPFYLPRTPASSDFDGNGLNDLALISVEDGLCISFQKEDDVWVTENIGRYFYTGSKLVCFDLNGDGLEDIIGSSSATDEISWWENPGTIDSEWTKHILEIAENSVLSMVVDDYNGDGVKEMYIVTSHWPNILRIHRFDENEYSQYQIDIFSMETYILPSNWSRELCLVKFSLENEYVPFRPDTSSIIRINRIELMILLNDSNISDVESTFPRLLALINTRQTFRGGTFLLFEHQDSGWVADSSLLSEQLTSMVLRPVSVGDIDNDGDQDICTLQYYFENISDDGSWIVHDYKNAGSHENLVCADIDGNGTEELIYLSNNHLWFIDHSCTVKTGELLSEVLFAYESTIWQDITWSSDEPEGTSISFYVRFDDMNPMDWYGPIYEPRSLLDFRESSSGSFQYKVVLESDDLDVTPVLNSVTVTWE